MNEYTTITFQASAEHTSIITALLMNIGFDGIEEQENQAAASIAAADYDPAEVAEIFNRYSVPFVVTNVAPQNWNANWERSFEPVVVGDFVAIRADFHPPVAAVKYDLVITPKMSFGTGHHATTFMMVQLMSEIDFAGKTVIDFGTGTGVLAILAEKMGATEILAIDNDQWSINNSLENIDGNNGSRIVLKLAEEMIVEKKVDVILANINRNVIMMNLHAFVAAAHENTNILISGFLTEDEDQMYANLSAGGFRIVKKMNNKNWLAMLIKLK